MGTQPPPKKGAEPPPQKKGKNSASVYCGQTAAWIKAPLGTEVGLGLRDVVLDGDPAPPSPKVAQPQILAHVYCGQTAGWMKTPLGSRTEVSLIPGHIVLDGDKALPRKGHSSPSSFWPMSIMATVAHLSKC